MSQIRFSLHSENHPFLGGITLEALLDEQKKDGIYWAHAEDSGCESCYCEVARWSDERGRWERFACLKAYYYRLPELPDASDEETAGAIADQINALAYWHGRANIVHRMPSYQPAPTPTP